MDATILLQCTINFETITNLKKDSILPGNEARKQQKLSHGILIFFFFFIGNIFLMHVIFIFLHVLIFCLKHIFESITFFLNFEIIKNYDFSCRLMTIKLVMMMMNAKQKRQKQQSHRKNPNRIMTIYTMMKWMNT